jgi:hypothetical protein
VGLDNAELNPHNLQRFNVATLQVSLSSPSLRNYAIKLHVFNCCVCFAVYPGSRFFIHHGSRILDPGSKNSNKRVTKFFVLPFFSHKNITKLKLILFWNWRRKKIWANLQRIIELFTQKIVIRSQKYGLGSGIQNPGSGKKPVPEPGPGVRTERQRILDPDPQH